MVFSFLLILFRDYRSISEFFTRSLRVDARHIHDVSCVVSPADGTVLHFGLATGTQIEQVSSQNCSDNLVCKNQEEKNSTELRKKRI